MLHLGSRRGWTRFAEQYSIWDFAKYYQQAGTPSRWYFYDRVDFLHIERSSQKMLCDDESTWILWVIFRSIYTQANFGLYFLVWIWIAYKYWSRFPHPDDIQLIYQWTKRCHPRRTRVQLWLSSHSNCWRKCWVKWRGEK